MSASNFYSVNSAAVFAVTDNGLACRRVRTSGRRRGWEDVYKLEIWDHSRSYGGRSILEKSFSVALPGGLTYELDGVIVRRFGYYSGASLDWDVKCDAGSLAEDFRGDLDELADAIAEDLIADYRYYSGWNNGLVSIFRPRIQRAVSSVLGSIQKQADALCAWGCDVKLRCLWHFSNGAGVYVRS